MMTKAVPDTVVWTVVRNPLLWPTGLAGWMSGVWRVQTVPELSSEKELRFKQLSQWGFASGLPLSLLC